MSEKYSVLMSVYYKEKPEYIRQALNSMLAQTAAPDEIVLVCDGPLPEDLDGVIAEYQQRSPELFNIVRLSENVGLGIALAKGLDHCRNEFVARMDADDIAVPERMEKQLDVLCRMPQVAAVGGQIAEFDDTSTQTTGYRMVPTQPEDVLRRVKFKNPMNHMTVTFRKSRVLEAGNYQSLLWFEDYFLWSRMLACGQILCNVEDVCCNVRVNQCFYDRRSGMKYFKNAVLMCKQLLALGLINRLQYVANLFLRFFGHVVISNNLRSILYNNILRSSSMEK